MIDSLEKNHERTYRYDDSKYTKMILGYHATFFAACIWKLHEIQICIHIWCDYFMSESLVYTANLQTLIL